MAGKEETPGSKQHGGDQPSRPTPAAPATIAADGADDADNRDNHQQDGGHKRRSMIGGLFPRGVKTAEWIMIVFTAVTAAATWYGVFVNNQQAGSAAGQLSVMQQQLLDSETASWKADAAADAANARQGALDAQKVISDAAANKRQQDLIDANKKLADVTTNAELRANRAWIRIKPPATIIDGRTHKIDTYITIVNTGHEPATDVKVRTKPIWVPIIYDDATRRSTTFSKLKFPPNDSCEGVGKVRPVGAMWPDPEGITTTDKTVTAHPEVLAGNEMYGVQTCVTYLTFGKRHYTKMCSVWEPLNGPQGLTWRTGVCLGRGQQDAN